MPNEQPEPQTVREWVNSMLAPIEGECRHVDEASDFDGSHVLAVMNRYIPAPQIPMLSPDAMIKVTRVTPAQSADYEGMIRAHLFQDVFIKPGAVYRHGGAAYRYNGPLICIDYRGWDDE